MSKIQFIPVPVVVGNFDIETTFTAIYQPKIDDGYGTEEVIGFYTKHRGTGIHWGTVAAGEESKVVEFSSEDREVSYPHLAPGGYGYSEERSLEVLHQYIRDIHSGKIVK